MLPNPSGRSLAGFACLILKRAISVIPHRPGNCQPKKGRPGRPSSPSESISEVTNLSRKHDLPSPSGPANLRNADSMLYGSLFMARDLLARHF